MGGMDGALGDSYVCEGVEDRDGKRSIKRSPNGPRRKPKANQAQPLRPF